MLALLPIAFAISLQASQIYTIPQPLEDVGYLYLTFCSQSSGSEKLKFYGKGFSVEPEEQEVYFSPVTSATGIIPDCKTIAVKVRANKPGMYELHMEGNEQDWYLPVTFWKRDIEVEANKLRLYTGYEDVGFYIHGNASDVWVTINSSVVGSIRRHFQKLPASFEAQLFFPKPGYYAVPVEVSYKQNNARFKDVFLIGFRVDEFPLEVNASSNLYSGELGFVNLSISSPRPLYSVKVKLVSPCLEGESEKYIKRLEKEKISFLVKAKCDPGVYSAKVYVGSYEREIPLEIKGKEGIEIFVSPEIEKNKASLEVTVANTGKDKLEAVSVRLLPGNYTILDEGTFLGTLDPGDFDSAELNFIPKAGKVRVRYLIEFTRNGKREEIERSYELEVGEKSFNFWLLALIAAVIAYVYIRKAGSKVSRS